MRVAYLVQINVSQRCKKIYLIMKKYNQSFKNFFLFFGFFLKKGYFIGVKINKTQKPGVYNSNQCIQRLNMELFRRKVNSWLSRGRGTDSEGEKDRRLDVSHTRVTDAEGLNLYRLL